MHTCVHTYHRNTKLEKITFHHNIRLKMPKQSNIKSKISMKKISLSSFCIGHLLLGIAYILKCD